MGNRLDQLSRDIVQVESRSTAFPRKCHFIDLEIVIAITIIACVCHAAVDMTSTGSASVGRRSGRPPYVRALCGETQKHFIFEGNCNRASPSRKPTVDESRHVDVVAL